MAILERKLWNSVLGPFVATGFLLLVVLSVGCGAAVGVNDEEVASSELRSTFLKVSHQPDRSGATALNGASLSGDVYVFGSALRAAVEVDFFLDDPALAGAPRQIDTHAPYDFAGGSALAAHAFDTRSLQDGSHSISCRVRYAGGRTETSTARFSLHNHTPSPSDAGVAPSDAGVPPPTPGWKLVWSDEFDGTGHPDSTKWGYEVGHVRNNELQYYTADCLENARVENGNLVIEARNDNFNGNGVTSASLTTQGHFALTYGRIEFRAKIPTGRGTWPGLWTLGTNINSVGWPACGEIDVMENVGFEPNNIYGSIHTPSANRSVPVVVNSPFNAFHVYAVDWSPSRIDFWVDGNKYTSYANPGSAGGWPFDKPQYLLMNLAIGGSWGGTQGVDYAIFPAQLLIDYVRVYQWH